MKQDWANTAIRLSTNLSGEVLAHRWTLIILRDMIFGGRRHIAPGRAGRNSEIYGSGTFLSGYALMVTKAAFVAQAVARSGRGGPNIQLSY